jgi:2,3-bisphosphoglycerate-independent phosphoglycerate mutase
MKYSYKPVVLVVLDGFGIDTSAVNSPWQIAKHPAFFEIEKFWPFTTLQASGVSVGLPWKEEGNSEVGHLTMGSGRIIFNHLPRIISAINNGSFFQNEAFLKAIKQVREKNSSLHLLGLFSSGSVHSYEEHVLALLELVKKNAIPKVYLHLFADGRDSPQREAAEFIKNFKEELAKYPMAKIASLIGREYAMDRDGNWEKTEKTYKLLTEGQGNAFQDAVSYLEEQYKKGLNDEKIEPAYASTKEGLIKNGDAVIFWNFREDSARQLTQSFIDKNFTKFKREYLNDLVFVTMTEYDKKFSTPAAFPPLDVKWPLSAVISQAGLKQLHLAESEKYAHVTYFFNGGSEKPFDNEERILIPSPGVPFEEKPEMSAEKVTEAILENINKYDFILANFANADMVGHTANFEACVKAIESLDYFIGKIIPVVTENGGILIITADHGNIEEKIYKLTGEKRTKHSNNPVPFYLISEDLKRKESRTEEEIKTNYRKVEGTLADIAPTILELFNLPEPEEMTGRSLLNKLL